MFTKGDKVRLRSTDRTGIVKNVGSEVTVLFDDFGDEAKLPYSYLELRTSKLTEGELYEMREYLEAWDEMLTAKEYSQDISLLKSAVRTALAALDNLENEV